MKKIALFLTVFIVLTSLSCFSYAPAEAEGTKMIALTFDDGPSKYTAVLLDALKEYGAKATFFTVGSRISYYPEIVKRITDEGHQLAGHTYSHKDLRKLSPDEAKSEMDKCVDAIKDYAGYKKYLIRPPYGGYNDEVKALGYPLIRWDLDTLDWKSKNADKVYEVIMRDTEDGDVLLMHDLYETSVAGIIRALPELKEQGYEFVTISELFRRRGNPITEGSVYSRAIPKGNDLPAASAPEITVSVNEGTVSMKTGSGGFSIYYTTDGSKPTAKSTLYESPVSLNGKLTVKAVAIDDWGTKSPVTTLEVDMSSVQEIKPIFADGKLTLSCETPDATIRYTTDGSDVTKDSPVYTEPIIPSSSIKASGWRSDLKTGPTLHLTYTSYGDLVADVDKDSKLFPTVERALGLGLIPKSADCIVDAASPLTKALAVYQLKTVLGDVTPYDEAKAAEASNKSDTKKSNKDTEQKKEKSKKSDNPIKTADAPEKTTAEKTEPEKPVFEDLDAESPYYDAAIWAIENDLASPVSDTIFGTDNEVTNSEFCSMLAAYIKMKNLTPVSTTAVTENFADSESIADEFKAAVESCREVGLADADGDNNFNPTSFIERIRSAKLILSLSDKIEAKELIVTSTTTTTTSMTVGAKPLIGKTAIVIMIIAAALVLLGAAVIVISRTRAARRREKLRREYSERVRKHSAHSLPKEPHIVSEKPNGQDTDTTHNNQSDQ